MTVRLLHTDVGLRVTHVTPSHSHPDLYQSAIVDAPAAPNLYWSALALHLSGHGAEAEEKFLEAIADGEVNAVIKLATLYSDGGRFQDAIELISKFIKDTELKKPDLRKGGLGRVVKLHKSISKRMAMVATLATANVPLVEAPSVLQEALPDVSNEKGLPLYSSNKNDQETANQMRQGLNPDRVPADTSAILTPSLSDDYQETICLQLPTRPPQQHEGAFALSNLVQYADAATDSLGQWTSLGFSTRLLPQLAGSWAPGHSPTCWLQLHLALLSCRFIQVPEAAWVCVYREAMGDICHHCVVPVEPTWLAFDDVWKGGLETTWERAYLDPGTLQLFVLQDCSVAICGTWLRPLLNLSTGVSNRLLPRMEEGWPPNLRVLWTAGYAHENRALVDHLAGFSAVVPRRFPDVPDIESAPGFGNPVLPMSIWNSWLGDTPPEDQCPLTIPVGTQLGSRAATRDLCRYYGAAKHCGLPAGLSTQLASLAFTSVLEPQQP